MSTVILFQYPFILLLVVLTIPLFVIIYQLFELWILPRWQVSQVEIAATAMEMINRNGARASELADHEFNRAWRRGEVVTAGIWQRVVREINRRQADPRF